jgi:hypothetical protein
MTLGDEMFDQIISNVSCCACNGNVHVLVNEVTMLAIRNEILKLLKLMIIIFKS